jgi:DNA repair protein RadD
MSEFHLYPFQQAIFNEMLVDLFNRRHPLVQLPTGAGKTHLAAYLGKVTVGKSIWFVCHRAELVAQTERVFVEAGASYGVVSAKGASAPQESLQICMIGSLPRRFGALRRPEIMIFDECHHLPARTWHRLGEEFDEAIRVGLTATPYRLDGAALDPYFSRIINGPPTRTLIEQNYLSDFVYYAPSRPNLSGVRVSRRSGEFDQSQLEKIMMSDVLIGDVVDHYKRLAPGRKALVYCVSIDASMEIAGRFNKAGIIAAHVDADTPENERKDALAALADGRIEILCNVELFTEGLDIPDIGAVILLRPTRSLGLARQMIGRGMRAKANSEALIVLDHANLYAEFGTPDYEYEWRLDGKPPTWKRPLGEGASAQLGRVLDGGAREIDFMPGFLERVQRPPVGCVTGKEFAKLVGVSDSTISKWIRFNGMPNDRGFIDPAVAKKWMQSRGLPGNSVSPPPEGCETQAAFARRNGISISTVRNWICKLGMPTVGNSVDPKQCESWMKSNGLPRTISPPEGCETQRAFAERLGIKSSTVFSYIKRGMPVRRESRQQTYIDIDQCLEWVKFNAPDVASRVFRTCPATRKKDFCREFGISSANFHRLVKRGMPQLSEHFVDTDAAAEWLSENWSSLNHIPNLDVSAGLEKYRLKIKMRPRTQQIAAKRHSPPPPKKPPEGFETITGLCALIGVTEQTLRKWIRSGMPTVEIDQRRLIPIKSALDWIEQNRPKNGKGRNGRLHSHWWDVPDGFERKTVFSKRVSCSNKTLYRWLEGGLPVSECGNFIPVTEGLKWVRDRRSEK